MAPKGRHDPKKGFPRRSQVSLLQSVVQGDKCAGPFLDRLCAHGNRLGGGGVDSLQCHKGTARALKIALDQGISQRPKIGTEGQERGAQTFRTLGGQLGLERR